jgi:hypothetical protein
MIRLPKPCTPLAPFLPALLAACGDPGPSERERLLEERLAQAEARATTAESEVAKARAMLEQQAAAGADEPDDAGDPAEFDDPGGQPDEVSPDGSAGPN